MTVDVTDHHIYKVISDVSWEEELLIRWLVYSAYRDPHKLHVGDFSVTEFRREGLININSTADKNITDHVVSLSLLSYPGSLGKI